MNTEDPKNSVDPKKRLLEAAGEIFAEKGFEAATIREICQSADANIAAVNYHFGDKHQLYVEAVKQAHCTQVSPSDLTAWDGLSAEAKLQAFVTLMMSDMLDDDRPSWHLALIMRELSQPTHACEELVKSFIGPKFEYLCGILQELLPADISLPELHLHAFSVVGQCLLYRFHRAIGRLLVGPEEFNRLHEVTLLAEHITQFSLDGIRGSSGHASRSAPLSQGEAP